MTHDTPAPGPPPRALERIHSLDGIRAVAALMVMVFHFMGHHGEHPRIVQISGLGQTGVDLFFVLSGFLITRILLVSKDSKHYFKAFYARRTLRIFPLYYGYLALSIFVLPHLFGNPVPAFESHWWFWVYLQNVPATFPLGPLEGPGHFWSLAVEEHFYLVWPLLVYWLSRKHFGVAVAATLILPPILRVIFLHHDIEVFYFTLTRVDALGFGALLALLLTQKKSLPPRHLWLFRVLLVILALLLVPAFVLLSGSRLDWLQALKSSLIPAFYFAFIGFCIVDPLAWPLTAILSMRWLRGLGTISYGLYVFHPACFELVARFAGPTSFALDAALSFGLTVLVACASFHIFESPISALKRHFRYETVPTARIAS